MCKQDKEGLRFRGTTKAESTYDIEVRTRPVNGSSGIIATHAFIVLLDGFRIVDSLSFDPSNSIGMEDGRPEDDSRGSEVIGKKIKMDAWLKLKEAFRLAANRVYDLRYYNCTHAVCAALIASPLLPGTTAGIELSLNANRTWDALHGRLNAEKYIKKNK